MSKFSQKTVIQSCLVYSDSIYDWDSFCLSYKLLYTQFMRQDRKDRGKDCLIKKQNYDIVCFTTIKILLLYAYFYVEILIWQIYSRILKKERNTLKLLWEFQNVYEFLFLRTHLTVIRNFLYICVLYIIRILGFIRQIKICYIMLNFSWWALKNWCISISMEFCMCVSTLNRL